VEALGNVRCTGAEIVVVGPQTGSKVTHYPRSLKVCASARALTSVRRSTDGATPSLRPAYRPSRTRSHDHPNRPLYLVSIVTSKALYVASVYQTDVHRNCYALLVLGRPSVVDRTSSSSYRSIARYWPTIAIVPSATAFDVAIRVVPVGILP